MVVVSNLKWCDLFALAIFAMSVSVYMCIYACVCHAGRLLRAIRHVSCALLFCAVSPMPFNLHSMVSGALQQYTFTHYSNSYIFFCYFYNGARNAHWCYRPNLRQPSDRERDGLAFAIINIQRQEIYIDRHNVKRAYETTPANNQYAGPSNHCPLSQIIMRTMDIVVLQSTCKGTEIDKCKLEVYIFTYT